MFSSEGFSETNRLPSPHVELGTRAQIDGETEQGVVKNSDTTPHKERRSSSSHHRPDASELDHEDSDFEDDLYPAPTRSPSIYRIEVRQIAYKTLYSFLHYLETGHIEFATLSSLLRNSPSRSFAPLGNASTSARPVPPPSSHPTCSPKSMYLLAHLYEHSKLRQLAFDAIASQLGSNNALFEYFSDLSSLYPEIRTITLRAVLDNWDVVKDSREMHEMRSDLEEGRIEKEKVGLFFDLFAKLKPA